MVAAVLPEDMNTMRTFDAPLSSACKITIISPNYFLLSIGYGFI